jgi:hypothetical protein
VGALRAELEGVGEGQARAHATNATPASYEVDRSGIAGALPQGPEGPQGPAGPAGADGTNGTNGTNGANGKIGATGATGATGQTGAVGPRGPKGDPGAGLTGATITCKRAKVRRKRVLVRCTLKLAVTARVRGGSIRIVTVDRAGRLRSTRRSVHSRR